ncbi:type IV pilus biogenesis/stability protein PilW [Pseudoalteromonas rubra]|uniref:Type IV pilus biogenesis/stability protein PilW n=1 Tax=Pseudoalteromonas rubra TaxID=43658 RepID=A0A5S3WN68_9GAMM|nr:type IV pilus biogenesis/stability protein PilW [Pseudoalteromonas rubra]TMP29391.1 type IV pilus biogenesis/stability protein PilW [Pseudoalteromonas rubra]TMP34006.1 type IV pilus biogenesis/stability protein PilW [Pseudoalteromonas rubra]
MFSLVKSFSFEVSKRTVAARTGLLMTLGVVLSGCVTETRYANSDKPVVQSKASREDAAKTRISLALQYLANGNNTQAKYNLERALTLAPQLPEAHYSLAYYYEQVGENARAEQAYQKALALAPKDPNTLNNYGTFLCRIGKYDEATEQLFKAIEIPSYIRVAQSYENLALCALRQDNFELALEYLSSAEKHNGQRQSTLLLMAGLHYAKSELHRAEEVLKVYGDRGFVSARGLLLSHLLELRKGHLQQAEETATLLLQTYPESPQAALVIQQRLKDSEFERLKEQYRQAQLTKITHKSPTHLVAEPKIKVRRKVEAVSTRVEASELSSVVSQQSQIKAPTRSLRTQQFTQNSPAQDTVSAATIPQKATSTVVKPVTSTQQGKVVFYEPDPEDISFSASSSRSSVEPTDSWLAQLPAEPASARTPNRAAGGLLNTDIMLPSIPQHTVRLGENLFSVSVKYNLKLEKLMAWNNLRESDKLSIGQVVYLNDPKIVHTIGEGQSLFDIAMEYNLQIDDLMRWNKLTPGIVLQPGRHLLIVDPDNYTL